MLNMVEQSEPRRLAETLWLGRSTVVNAINRLEKQGLVTREQAKNDRRLVVVEMTEAGKASLAEGHPAVRRCHRRPAEWRFTPEEISLCQLQPAVLAGQLPPRPEIPRQLAPRGRRLDEVAALTIGTATARERWDVDVVQPPRVGLCLPCR